MAVCRKGVSIVLHPLYFTAVPLQTCTRDGQGLRWNVEDSCRVHGTIDELERSTCVVGSNHLPGIILHTLLRRRRKLSSTPYTPESLI